MEPLLCGIETEYGLDVEGHGASEQIESSMALVRNVPGERFSGWDYHYESPRDDLRGFTAARLSFDPRDAAYDRGRSPKPDHVVRSDQVLANGARFYNDHGHPEYATPECRSIDELVRQDLIGETVALAAGRAFAESEGRPVRLYKNNTDFHGASFGCHENYLVPRAIGWERLYRALVPILIVRPLLCGAGKVGAEDGEPCDFQLSQRADFFSEPLSIDTLYRRPLFNTRDEPHADPQKWIRLHMIAGDANRISSCTWRKVALAQVALLLELHEAAPDWQIAHPVPAAKLLSRSLSPDSRIELTGGSWTTAEHVFESYFAAAEACGWLAATWIRDLIAECRGLIASLKSDGALASRRIDWAAKRTMLEEIREVEGLDWSDPSLKAYDLEYHNVDPEESLFQALVEMNHVDHEGIGNLSQLIQAPMNTRAALRGHVVQHFASQLVAISWRSCVLRLGSDEIEVEFPVEYAGGLELETLLDVESFVSAMRNLP